MREFFMFVFILVVLPTVLMIGGAIFFDSWVCKKYGEASERETKYMGKMCYVKQGGKWLTIGEMQLRNAIKGE